MEKDQKQNNKYDPNAPETEEDGLIAGQLRILKYTRISRELKKKSEEMSKSPENIQQTTKPECDI